MASALEDLDELTLRCRDLKAQQYIAEAVASYRSGAFRSAIVATWIAVCFDVIEKLRELALAGDKEAEKQIQDIESTRQSGELARALKFERELLTLAKDTFELISPLEVIDLARLQEDRNRCAHPSLTIDEQAYRPSAELARLHIHSAVVHLLQHPPAQGKFALERLLRDVNSDYFPSTVKEAKLAFSSGPLSRPRDSLIRNLVLVLVKTLLNEQLDWKRKGRVVAALRATQEMHLAQYSKTLEEKLSAILRNIENTNLEAAISFLRDIPDTWQFIDPDVRQRIENYVKRLPSQDLYDLDFLLQYPPLQTAARYRVQVATKPELSDTIFFGMPREIADRFISLYLDSQSFDDANEWAKEMLPHIGEFSADHIRRILLNASKNSQVLNSFQIAPLISKLRLTRVIPEAEFDELLIAHNLADHSKPKH